MEKYYDEHLDDTFFTNIPINSLRMIIRLSCIVCPIIGPILLAFPRSGLFIAATKFDPMLFSVLVVTPIYLHLPNGLAFQQQPQKPLRRLKDWAYNPILGTEVNVT